MKNLKLYVENHERLEVVTESLSVPLPKLSTILDDKTSTEPTSVSSFLEKLQREQLYRKHQFHRFRQMTLQTTTSTNSSIMFHEDETQEENTFLADIDITDMNPRRTNFTSAEHSTYNNNVDETILSLPLTTQMKQRWDVLLLDHRKKAEQRR